MMIDIREKLVELIHNGAGCPDGRHPFGDVCDGCRYFSSLDCSTERLADHLIAHGVTVQEWIPVTDDSPKNGVKVLIANEDIVRRGYRRPDGVWKYGAKLHERWDKLSLFPPTHWMPLPMPPKGGKQQ